DLARAPRGALPRRAARIQPQRARGAARAARVGPHHHLARRAPGGFPGALPARRGDESLPVRLPRALQRQMPLLLDPGRALSRPDLGPLPRPHRRARRGSRPRGGGPAGGEERRELRRRAHTRRPRTWGAARPPGPARRLLREAIAHHRLSARAHHRVLKVARTVADLEGSRALCRHHVAEALLYRGIAAPSAMTAATA